MYRATIGRMKVPLGVFALALALSWFSGAVAVRASRAPMGTTGQDKTCCEVITGPPMLCVKDGEGDYEAHYLDGAGKEIPGTVTWEVIKDKELLKEFTPLGNKAKAKAGDKKGSPRIKVSFAPTDPAHQCKPVEFDVPIVDPLQIRVCVIILTGDNGLSPRHARRLKNADFMKELLDGMNTVFAQLCIQLVMKGTPTELATDPTWFDKDGNIDPKAFGEYLKKASQAKPPGFPNAGTDDCVQMFMTGSILDKGKLANGLASGGTIYISNQAMNQGVPQIVRTMAHELGHVFGLGHVESNKEIKGKLNNTCNYEDLLMGFPGKAENPGTKITDDEAGKARQGAEKIQKGQAGVPGH